MLSRFYWWSRPLPLVGFAAMLFVLLSLLALRWSSPLVPTAAAQVGSCSAGIVSDDFTAATLDPAWTFVNPNNDASLHLDGANLQISVPAGPDHSIWLDGLQAPRIMQLADNTDFTLEAKFDTVPTLAAQLQGLLVQANATDYIRFDITSDHDNDGVHLFAISFAGGTPTVRVNQHLTAPDLPIWLRVTRSGNTWTLASSNDGTTWQTAGSFSFTLPVSQVGVFAGNEGTYPAPAPAFTASVDFFATASCPGQPDDPDGCAQVTVPFTGGPVAAAASRPFTGTTAITVTGTGQALGTQQSDAFHVFTTVDDFVSDDFLSTTLDARWSFLDPRDDSSLTLDGTRLQFNVPSGTSHDVWSGGNFAPRVLQPMDDADFALEAKFETLPSQQYQLQGILVEAASDDYIRFDTYSDGTNLRIFAATFDPNPTVKISEVIASPTTPFYLRVARSGDVWTMTYSFDRQTWHSPTGHTFAHALAVSQAGLFAGNAGSSPPAFTAQFDYLVNLACPGNPDDQHPLRPAECATQPQDGTLWINGAPATVLLPGQQAPTYRADHTYQVTIDAAGEPLVFGVGDSNVRDNSGSYEVTICPATSSSPLTTTTRLSAGFAHTCHITEAGGLACWGDDSYGQRTNLPTDTDFVQISAGQRHTCALRQGGQVACWGDDTYGQVSAPPSGSFTQVSAGWTHSCAVQSDGSIACWGDNTYGQAPASVTDASYTQVSAGQDVTCGVTSEQHLACWGRTTFGQRTPSAGLFQQVSAGRDFACGLHTDGSIQCWGNTFHAQVSARPDGTSPHFTQVQAGNAHVCAVSNAGDLVCWGWDDFNQTSDADTATGTYSEVSAGGAHTCALQANGTLACWGQNDDEQASPPTP